MREKRDLGRGRDLWFIGSIPQLTTAVWFGYDDSRTTRNTSGESAWAWKQFMTTVKGSFPVQQFPPKPVLTRVYSGPKGDRWDRSTVVKPKNDEKKAKKNDQPEDNATATDGSEGLSDALTFPLKPSPFLMEPGGRDDSAGQID